MKNRARFYSPTVCQANVECSLCQTVGKVKILSAATNENFKNINRRTNRERQETGEPARNRPEYQFE
jgi:hypothetical protein